MTFENSLETLKNKKFKQISAKELMELYTCYFNGHLCGELKELIENLLKNKVEFWLGAAIENDGNEKLVYYDCPRNLGLNSRLTYQFFGNPNFSRRLEYTVDGDSMQKITKQINLFTIPQTYLSKRYPSRDRVLQKLIKDLFGIELSEVPKALLNPETSLTFDLPDGGYISPIRVRGLNFGMNYLKELVKDGVELEVEIALERKICTLKAGLAGKTWEDREDEEYYAKLLEGGKIYALQAYSIGTR